MTTVLVVDDSAVDRLLVRGLLGKEDYEVRFAGDGIEAMAAIEQGEPDLVVTDLMMPRMDGLELVAAIRSRYPRVPVILMTSKGSEEVAVHALQQGASSYVPKGAMSQKLLETAKRVLSVSHRERIQARLLSTMTECRYCFVLSNDCTMISPLVLFLQDNATGIGLCDEADQTRVGVALEEALTNALYHGNLGIGSELRGEDDDAYYAQVAQRLQESPYRERHIHVEVKLSANEGVFVVRDEGSGFDLSTLPDPNDPAALERASGRGVLLMRAFMDDVLFNDVGNAVTLIKRHSQGQRVRAD